MLIAYLNYPDPHITIHRNPNCGAIQQYEKPDQRVVNINQLTISVELRRFAAKDYVFAANRDENDMWLMIDFDDAQFEDSILCYVQRLIGLHYRPFTDVEITTHDCIG